MRCHLCARTVLITWALGDGRGVCDGCIRRALKEAERANQVIDVLERMRRLGLG